ncbi:MAG: sulfatase-like hydrolase/transferase [Saprospiraceae bacterium]|nr:alkaline phosphatase family protein [Bacteroidia bacterium]NNL92693.1 sulfatase-like hydrolase/transferase [Saprospiraceae bacterium]
MSQKKKVIFYLIDGARPDVLNKLLDQDELPSIKENLVSQGSFVKGTTCLPSTTGPAYLPFLTGASPGDHHITGIRWFDKEEYFKGRWGRNAMRSYCGYEAKYFNDDMNPNYPSLFELYPEGYNIYNMVTKGVKEENDLTKEGKSKLYFDAHFKQIHHPVDEKGHERLLEAVEKDFDFIYAVFPSIDWDSHYFHYEDEKTIEAYRIVDRSLEAVVNKLKKQGDYENTLIVMASDHGLTSTHTHLDVGKFFKKNKYRVLEYPTIWTLFPKVAVFISGNSFASVSFLDHKTAYFQKELMEKHGTVLTKFVNESAIDFIAFRKNESALTVLNQEGEAEISFKNNLLGYKSITANPLGLNDHDTTLNFQEAFDFTYESEYPDSLYQIKQLFDSKRSGDIIVSANVGYDLRDFWEIPEHKGSHGSLHREHIHIPILLNKKGLDKPVRSTEVFKIIKDYLDS